VIDIMTTRYGTADVDGINILFREAGGADAPALLRPGMMSSNNREISGTPSMDYIRITWG
jgi:hypothetical protein